MEKLMDAIVKPVAGPGLELRRVPVPVPGPGEVLIKVHKTAICGTDVHIYNCIWVSESPARATSPATIAATATTATSSGVRIPNPLVWTGTALLLSMSASPRKT